MKDGFFKDLLRKRKHDGAQEILDNIDWAIESVRTVVWQCDREGMHVCCHVLTSVADIIRALLADDWQTARDESDALFMFTLDALYNQYSLRRKLVVREYGLAATGPEKPPKIEIKEIPGKTPSKKEELPTKNHLRKGENNHGNRKEQGKEER